MYEQNTLDFVRRLFLDAGFPPTQEDIERVVREIPAEVIAAADKLFNAMHPSQYVGFAEGGDTLDPAIAKVLDAIWDAYEIHG